MIKQKPDVCNLRYNVVYNIDPDWAARNKRYSRIDATTRMAKRLATAAQDKAIILTPQGGEHEKEPELDAYKIATPQRLPY